MRFINYEVVQFSLCFAFGIGLAHTLPPITFSPFYLVLFFLAILIIAWWHARTQLFPSLFFGIVTWISFVVLGYSNYVLRTPIQQSDHYTRHVVDHTHQSLQVKITEIVKPDRFNFKYIAEVSAVANKRTSGLLLLNLQKEDSMATFNIDDVLLVSAMVSDIPTPLNPSQFDYAAYMRTLGVHGQIRIRKPEVLSKKRSAPTLRGRAELLRSNIITKLRGSSIPADELAIIQALVLGQRQDISKELYSDYAAAGAIHILAVSGLHVGILYVLLLTLFRPLTYAKYGRTIRVVFIIVCLWGFAFITGNSPSVTRAVSMFTFFAFATLIERNTNSINTLFLSFFVLLILKPNWLFHVGFQLSYLAVFFILWIQPKLYSYYRPKWYLDKMIWGIITVTIAAQLGIVPLSLYYFHQFPGLFFITNLVVIPFLGLLLGLGILLVLLALMNFLPDSVATLYGQIIEKLNEFIRWVAAQDDFLFTDIHFSIGEALGSYLLLASLILCWKQLSSRTLSFVLFSTLFWISIQVNESFRSSENELVIFQKNRTTLIGVKHNKRLRLFQKDTTKSNRNTYPVKSYRVEKNCSEITSEVIPTILRYNNSTILLIDSLSVVPKNLIQPIDVLLLTDSPKINLETAIQLIRPAKVVADGSNYHSFVNRWKETCKKEKLPFHHTAEKGAFVLE